MDKSILARWHALPSGDVLMVLADFAKLDQSFVPVKNSGTTRWHASCNGRDFELLLTGTKFWDTRAKTGGGGAVDLAMHLAATDFKGAVRHLRARGL
ncbi:hypothetical protein D3C87_1097660 [compost metagenome]